MAELFTTAICANRIASAISRGLPADRGCGLCAWFNGDRRRRTGCPPTARTRWWTGTSPRANGAISETPLTRPGWSCNHIIVSEWDYAGMP